MRILKITLIFCFYVICVNAQNIKTRTAFTLFNEKDKQAVDTVITQIQLFDKSSKLAESKDVTSIKEQKNFKLTKYNLLGLETEIVKSYFDGQIIYNQKNEYDEKGLISSKTIKKYDSVLVLKANHEMKLNGKPERTNFVDNKGVIQTYIIYAYTKEGLKSQENEFKFPNYLLNSEKLVYDKDKRISESIEYDSKVKINVRKTYEYNSQNKISKIVISENDKQAYVITYNYDESGKLKNETKTYVDGTKVETFYKYDYWK